MFMFRLALSLGMTVRELGERMTCAEIAEWQAFYRLCPFGPDRQDIGAAIVASTIARANGAKVKPSAFMPKFGPREKQKPQGLVSKIMNWVKSFGAG